MGQSYSEIAVEKKAGMGLAKSEFDIDYISLDGTRPINDEEF